MDDLFFSDSLLLVFFLFLPTFLIEQIVGDGTMVTGWDKALRTMTVGERAIIRVTDPNLGYGVAGVPPLIPSNAELEFDIELLDAQPPMTNIDFDSIAVADNTPVSKKHRCPYIVFDFFLSSIF